MEIECLIDYIAVLKCSGEPRATPRRKLYDELMSEVLYPRLMEPDDYSDPELIESFMSSSWSCYQLRVKGSPRSGSLSVFRYFVAVGERLAPLNFC